MFELRGSKDKTALTVGSTEYIEQRKSACGSGAVQSLLHKCTGENQVICIELRSQVAGLMG